MGRYSGKSCRLLCMVVMTLTFFLVEITVGYVTNSLALVGDSYHMLSDVVALLVGLAAVRIAPRESKQNTFGWARAEVLGALVNAVFLIALCFTIFVEALQRMFRNEDIHDPDLMLIVGSIGLVINLIGLCLFKGHGHSHGGGGGSHGHSHGDKEERKTLQVKIVINGDAPTDTDDECVEKGDEHGSCTGSDTGRVHKLESSSQLNMRGVYLHVLGDALGSVIVIVSALIIKFVEHDWKFKVDPAMSMVMVIIILSTTLPLLKTSSLILLQTVPTHIKVHSLRTKLIEKVPGVLAVHELHIWQLTGKKIIATAHIRCHSIHDYSVIADRVKNFFHDEGIHSTTIQPEFVEVDDDLADSGRDCILECGPNKVCHENTCCGRKDAKTVPPLDPSRVIVSAEGAGSATAGHLSQPASCIGGSGDGGIMVLSDSDGPVEVK